MRSTQHRSVVLPCFIILKQNNCCLGKRSHLPRTYANWFVTSFFFKPYLLFLTLLDTKVLLSMWFVPPPHPPPHHAHLHPGTCALDLKKEEKAASHFVQDWSAFCCKLVLGMPPIVVLVLSSEITSPPTVALHLASCWGTVSSLVLWAQSTTKSYIRADGPQPSQVFVWTQRVSLHLETKRWVEAWLYKANALVLTSVACSFSVLPVWPFPQCVLPIAPFTVTAVLQSFI